MSTRKPLHNDTAPARPTITTVSPRHPMTAQNNIPHVTMEFEDTGTYHRRYSTHQALIATSSPYSTMELSTYKGLYPREHETDDETEHNYTTITNPNKNYTLISYKHIKATYYLRNETDKILQSSKFYIIQDTNYEAPEITIGSDTLFDPALISSITARGINLADTYQTLIPYSYIIKTPTPTRSMIYSLLSPVRARVRSTPTRPFHHQTYQLQSPTTDENQDQRLHNTDDIV